MARRTDSIKRNYNSHESVFDFFVEMKTLIHPNLSESSIYKVVQHWSQPVIDGTFATGTGVCWEM